MAKEIPIRPYGSGKPYSVQPKCPCYTTSDTSRALREAIMISDALAIGKIFEEACRASLVCDVAKPWFAALLLTDISATIAGVPKVTDGTTLTKDQITKTNYSIRVALDDIVERATTFLEERSKEMIE